jgi:hypothetical protein
MFTRFCKQLESLAFSLALGIAATISYADTQKTSQPNSFIQVLPEPAAPLHSSYFRKLLQLTLTKTEFEYGKTEISTSESILSSARAFRQLNMGRHVDVIWNMIDTDRARDFIAVPIPLLKDLNSYRVFLIRREDQPKFDKIHSLV